jgi:phosphoribosylglycinamide formyltransferase 1
LQEFRDFMNGFRPLTAPLGRPIRLAVLISGGGTTLMNLVEKIRAGTLAAEISLVVASRPDCSGIQRAVDAGLHCEVVSRKTCSGVGDFSDRIFSLCRDASADLVVCGGFLALIKIPADFAGRVINIHPALIPAFCGKGYHGHHVHEAVLDRGARVSGCTVHFVDDEYDHGPIILQQVVPVEDEDSPESLAARVFAAECDALPEAIRLFAGGTLEIHGCRVRRASAD